jgi:hypothetical protein
VVLMTVYPLCPLVNFSPSSRSLFQHPKTIQYT